MTINFNLARPLVIAVVSSTLFCSEVCQAQVREFAKTPRALSFSSDGRYLAIGAELSEQANRGVVYVWDLQKDQLSRAHEESGPVLDVDFFPDSNRIAYVASTNELKILSLATGMSNIMWSTDADSLRLVDVSADGRRIAAGDGGSTFYWGNTTDFEANAQSGGEFAFSPDGELVLISGEEAAQLMKIETFEIALEFAPTDLVSSDVKFSADGEWMVIGRNDGVVRVRSIHNGTVRARLKVGTGRLDISPDHKWLAVVNYFRRRSLLLFPLDLREPTDEEARRIEEITEKWNSDDYSVREEASAALVKLGMVSVPALDSLAESENAEIRIRARKARNQVRSPNPITLEVSKEGHVFPIAFSPDSRYLAVGDEDGAIRFWDLETLEIAKVIQF